ncbi:MAG: M50 family metallopeptidase [Streptosporangiaceae bacterium]
MGMTQAPLPGAEAALIGLAALGLLLLDAGWLIVRHLTVMAHEGAHALTAALMLREFHGIELDAKAGGGTYVPTNGLGGVFIHLAGYVGPSIFGLGAAKLITAGHSATVLWIVFFLLAFLLVGLRRSFGLITVILTGALVFGVARFTPTGVQVAAAYSITWLLLLSAVRRVVEIGARSDDGDKLRGKTGIPRLIWFLFWLAATLAAVAVGGRMLILQA